MVKINLWRNQPPKYSKTIPTSTSSVEDLYHLEEVESIMEELNTLIGLRDVKKIVAEIYAYIKIREKRCREKLVTEPMTLHMIFKGSPGTGKTTVARIMGKLFKELGVLQKGHIIEVERGDIVGEYIGQTAQKTRMQLKRAMGGILFIDEAYSLARGGEKDFGQEAVDTLVKSMEDFRELFILILAGYHNEMDHFLLTNPGLRSRFPIKITFPNYSTHELLAIANLMLKEREYVLSAKAGEELKSILERESYECRNSGNARLVRNIIEHAIRQQAVRLLREREYSRNNLLTIKREDLICFA